MSAARSPIKLKARTKLNNWLRLGRVTRLPCERCENPKSQAHHEDYSKPLDVRWLCSSCHGLEHRRTHCISGHALSGDNVRISVRAGRTERCCKTCCQEAVRRFRVKAKAFRAEQIA